VTRSTKCCGAPRRLLGERMVVSRPAEFSFAILGETVWSGNTLTRRSIMSATTAHQPANVMVGFRVVAVVLVALTRGHLRYRREELD
jgi:hypothetical protein